MLELITLTTAVFNTVDISACDVTPSTRRPSFRNCDVMSGHDKGPFQIFQTTPLQPSAPPLQGGVSCVDATRANDTSGQVDCQHCLRASVACDVCRRSASGRAYDYPVDDCDVTSSIMRSYNGIFNWSDGCDWSDHSHLPFCRLMPPPPPYTD